MKKSMSAPDDDHTIRCPRLGHNLGFSYCRIENNGKPCFKALDCWFEHFEVQAYFEARLDPDTLQQVFHQPPKPKMLSLFELIKQAQAKPPEKTPG